MGKEKTNIKSSYNFLNVVIAIICLRTAVSYEAHKLPITVFSIIKFLAPIAGLSLVLFFGKTSIENKFIVGIIILSLLSVNIGDLFFNLNFSADFIENVVRLFHVALFIACVAIVIKQLRKRKLRGHSG